MEKAKKAENALQTWTNDELGTIRSMVVDGEPWFVAKDLAKALGYKDTSDALKKHVDADDKLSRQIADSGQRRKVYIINESGMYALIFGSQLESAKKFKRWVTSEVLPQIRRTGSFGNAGMNEQTEKALKDFEQRFDLLEAMILRVVKAAKEPDIPNVTDARERVVKLVKQAAKAVSLTERETWYELYRGYTKFSGIPLLQTARAMNMTVIEYIELIDRMESLEKFAEQVFWFV